VTHLLEQILTLFHFFKDPFALLLSAVDILIVAWIIYRLLLLVRGTRAAYTLTGLLVVAAVFLAAHQLALTTLTWLLDNIINYVIIIIIIVFQADIRRGLMRVGHRIFSTSSVTDDVTVIEQVVAACEAMSRDRIGALVVFERDVDLSESVEPGTPIEAKVTRELLCNIFAPWPENVLHDGAVVIKGKRIRECSVVLPLSRNPSLDKALGTRHRAALGITEETDAVAVVVSEQRGTIGLAASGVLHVSLPPQILRRELLLSLTIAEKPKASWLERLFSRSQTFFGAQHEGSEIAPVRPTSRATGPLPVAASPKPGTGPHPPAASAPLSTEEPARPRAKEEPPSSPTHAPEPGKP
jgi:diadenylate cyclase